jgi:hypothetical protein
VVLTVSVPNATLASVKVDFLAGVASDDSGNTNTAATRLSYFYGRCPSLPPQNGGRYCDDDHSCFLFVLLLRRCECSRAVHMCSLPSAHASKSNDQSATPHHTTVIPYATQSQCANTAQTATCTLVCDGLYVAVGPQEVTCNVG